MLRWLKFVFLYLLVFVFNQYSLHAQIKLPAIFTDSMVLQQKMPIPVWGESSCRNCQLEISLGKNAIKTKTDNLGKWFVKLPAIAAGGPYTLTISDKHNRLQLKEILIGEVWLCSGQSNMEFMLKQSVGGKEEIKKADFSSIRLYQMTARSETRPTAKKVYSKETLKELEQFKFYKKTAWSACSAQTVGDFSAVAYYFGKQLHQKLNVPVGLICNAVGGTSTQAYISNEAFKSHPQLVQFTKQEDGTPWIKSVKEIHPWLLERIGENLKDFEDKGSDIYPHPFAPSYLYEAGVKPLIPFAIAGVIWYQGESNTTFSEIHDQLFKTLVESWRKEWQQGDFPFYYVQLPKISDRRRWPDFRESQRRLSEILTNTGMAVTIDTGDSLDVHPKEKKVVGERLALIALEKKYGFPVKSSGPTFKSYTLTDDHIEIYFDNASELKTQDGNTVRGFTVHGYEHGKKEVILALDQVKLSANKLSIAIPKGIMPFRVSYAWVPYPDCNLINEAHLPASPFKIEIPGDK